MATPLDRLRAAAPGQRWVVRVRRRDGSATDVIGWLIRVEPDSATLAGPIDPLSSDTGGEWTLRNSTVLAARRAPAAAGGPPPARTAPADLERLTAPAWAEEMEPLGEWWLRAAGGFTGRANSCLAVGDPGLPIPAAATRIVGYAAEHGIPARAQVVTGSTPDAALRDLGWSEDYVRTDVLAIRLADLLVDRDLDSQVTVEETLTSAWRTAYDRSRRSDADPATITAVLVGRPPRAYASVVAGDEVIGLARGHLAGPWLGLASVWTAPTHRRQGVSTALTARLGHWAARRGARYAYLQVAADNAVGHRTYARLGFTLHHRYHYLAPPAL